MKQPTFDAGYRTQLRRWNELFGKHDRTWQEQQEFEALHRMMDAHERSTLSAVVSDYEVARQLYEAGNLGVVEL